MPENTDERKQKMNKFLTRVASGAVILVLTIVLGVIGGPALGTALCIIACIGYVEFTNATKVREEGHRFNALQVVGLVTIVAYYGALLLQDDMYCPEALKGWLSKNVGSKVNLENDIIGKYVQRLLNINQPQKQESRIDEEFLAKHGFI